MTLNLASTPVPAQAQERTLGLRTLYSAPQLWFHSLLGTWADYSSVLCLSQLQNGNRIPVVWKRLVQGSDEPMVKTCSSGLGFTITSDADVMYYCHQFPGAFRSCLQPVPHRSRAALMEERSFHFPNKLADVPLSAFPLQGGCCSCTEARPSSFCRLRTPGMAAAAKGN